MHDIPLESDPATLDNGGSLLNSPLPLLNDPEGEYLPMNFVPDLAEFRDDRVMYGTDFSNLPYAWDRKLNRLLNRTYRTVYWKEF